MAWQKLASYEYEYDENGYTGWYRCINGVMADGRWPEWNSKTGQERFSHHPHLLKPQVNA